MDQIKVEKYNSEKHKKYLKKWLKLRGMPINSTETLPTLGVIAFKGEIPISAAFIRKVEGEGFGIVDSLIADPRIPYDVRDQSINETVSTLLKEAKELNYTNLIAVSFSTNTISRGQRFFGFSALPHTVMAVKL